MHDAGARDFLQFRIAPEKPVHEGAVWVACARMNHKARGLVDDDDGVVLVDHFKFDVLLGLERKGLFHAGRFEKLDFVALGRLRADLVHDSAVHLDGARFDHLLQTRAGNVGHEGGEHFVQALAPEAFDHEFRQRLIFSRSIFKRFQAVVFKILAAIIFAV